MDATKIKQHAREIFPEVVEMRHYLHAHPELSWQEVETSKFIEAKLKELGYANIRRGFGGTACGVTADMTGNTPGPRVALRADIDALPVTEQNTCAYKSTADNVMHACGHDGHIAALLGTAKLLAEMKDQLRGSVRLIFQPAEESGRRSGAKAMVEEGVLDGVDAIGGMHLWSFVPTGVVQWRNGPVMASADGWKAVFTGKGGHGAMPHEAIDPTVAAANFIGTAQTIVSREMNPLDAVVVSLGQLNAGDAFNIIPSQVEMTGSIRTFNPEVRKQMEDRLRRMADGIAAAYRCTAEVEVDYFYPGVVNDANVTDALRACAVEVAGEANVQESPLLMVSEDFSYYQQKIPGTFFFVGVGNREKGTDYPHHSPNFNIDEEGLKTSISVMTCFAARMLEKLSGGTLGK